MQKQVYDKSVKLCSYAYNENVWFNDKNIKIKQNKKLKAKFFKSFQDFYLVNKQAYKLDLFA